MCNGATPRRITFYRHQPLAGVRKLHADGAPAECCHRLHLVPSWKSLLRFNAMGHLMPRSRRDQMAAEVFGVLGHKFDGFLDPKPLAAAETRVRCSSLATRPTRFRPYGLLLTHLRTAGLPWAWQQQSWPARADGFNRCGIGRDPGDGGRSVTARIALGGGCGSVRWHTRNLYSSP